MHLIIGGAYQGKLDYARREYGITEQDIFHCTDSLTIDSSKRCICGFEKYLRACSREGAVPCTEFPDGAVIICRDIFCGIVPADSGERAWRELAGRTLTALAQRAESVTRIFCGIPSVLR